jgi:hypothetical protein
MRSTLCLSMAMLWTLAGAAGAQAQTQCNAGTQYTYTFTSYCPYPVWIGQHSTTAPTSYPPTSGNWALASVCTSNSQCSSGTCSNGQCTCQSSTDCPGGAACQNNLCATSATFCMPQSWVSGTFWPRTGCTLSNGNLSCQTGQCGSPGMLDCGVGNNGGSPQNPVTQLEVTTNPGTANYDVSINAGYNVEMKVTTVGGSQNGGACAFAGCTSDLNATCPASLQLTSSGTVVGCLDPCTQCVRSSPSGLSCGTAIAGASGTDCNGNPINSVTYQDMYCAKNMADGNAQASSNQGTPTCFADVDCPAGSTCYFTGFPQAFQPPAGAGVCIDPNNPNYANAKATCGPTTVGQACGGYIFNYQGQNALGYTCQPVTYQSGGQQLTAYTCLPPTISGLGQCQPPNPNTGGPTQLYTGGGGLFNAAWITAGKQAGGGTTPYYEIFKQACPEAYTWQYDDAASGFGCSSMTGFDVTFCGSLAPQAKR